MNERIRELLEQAGIHFGRSATLDGNNIARFVTTSDMEKFAELIVKECLDVVAMRIYLGPEEICRQECKALASEIKEHFGVAE
jgi:hypothetical protein